MPKITITMIILLTITIMSCNKKATVDTTAPVITISSPTEGQDFMQMTATDSATVVANITDEDLHSYSILITQANGTDTLLYVPETHQEVNDLNISKKFPLHAVAGTISYKIKMNAEDHSSNEGEAERNFTVTHM